MTHFATTGSPVNKAQSWVVTEWAKKEPVYVAALVTWLILQGHNAFVSRWHWFSEGQWTSYGHYAAPALTAIITFVLAHVLRGFTAPWLKVKPVLESKAQQIGLDDTTMGFLAATVAGMLKDHVSAIASSQAATAAVPVQTAGPAGLSAGTLSATIATPPPSA